MTRRHFVPLAALVLLTASPLLLRATPIAAPPQGLPVAASLGGEGGLSSDRGAGGQPAGVLLVGAGQNSLALAADGLSVAEAAIDLAGSERLEASNALENLRAEETGRRNGIGFFWVLALTGCSAVGMAAFRAE